MGTGGSVLQWHPGLGVSLAYVPTQLSWFDNWNERAAELQKVAAECAERMARENM